MKIHWANPSEKLIEWEPKVDQASKVLTSRPSLKNPPINTLTWKSEIDQSTSYLDLFSFHSFTHFQSLVLVWIWKWDNSRQNQSQLILSEQLKTVHFQNKLRKNRVILCIFSDDRCQLHRDLDAYAKSTKKKWMETHLCHLNFEICCEEHWNTGNKLTCLLLRRSCRFFFRLNFLSELNEVCRHRHLAD